MTPACKVEPSNAEGGTTIVLPGQTPEGQHILGVLLKRTYDIIPNEICRRASVDKELISGDVYWDDPMNSSVRYESDFVPFKLATDVVVNGRAYAPKGVPTESCTVSIQIGERRNEILVIGDRFAHFVNGSAPIFTDPALFSIMDLRYERAYGGIDIYSDSVSSFPYPRNPLGCGFCVANTHRSVDDLALPNLEQPGARITPDSLCIGDYRRWDQQPFPAGFGWFPKTWLPRAQLAGVLPADRKTERELRQAYGKLVPAAQREAYLANELPDMDFLFFNGASQGFTLPYLAGGEPIVAENLSPEGKLSFHLPRDHPRLGLNIGSGVQEPKVAIQTAMIRMEDRQVDVVWRGAVPYEGPDWLPQMRQMDVSIQ